MTTTTLIRRSATAALLLIAVSLAASARPALAAPSATAREISISYRAFDGRLRHAAFRRLVG